MTIPQLHILAIYFLYNNTSHTNNYTLSLHDALPISRAAGRTPAAADGAAADLQDRVAGQHRAALPGLGPVRSEEHTSELQSRRDLVCRLLLEKKNERSGQYFRSAAELVRTV